MQSCMHCLTVFRACLEIIGKWYYFHEELKDVSLVFDHNQKFPFSLMVVIDTISKTLHITSTDWRLEKMSDNCRRVRVTWKNLLRKRNGKCNYTRLSR